MTGDSLDPIYLSNLWPAKSFNCFKLNLLNFQTKRQLTIKRFGLSCFGLMGQPLMTSRVIQMLLTHLLPRIEVNVLFSIAVFLNRWFANFLGRGYSHWGRQNLHFTTKWVTKLCF